MIAAATMADVVHGVCFSKATSLAQIARHAGVSPRQASRALRKLAALGVRWHWDRDNGFVLHTPYADAVEIIDQYARRASARRRAVSG